ncbi:histidinol dehydrogenase [Candidatus Cyanaurora vandensis]|uniref:histidinol dehydrogenase n=1 Tax=Candidatus Cyanaurora vandensis TaxID=2714958 RepID=UPI00257E9A1D|nr:histidinol dehydrogenase [Candidatus Cyanaurora vandensis]
MLRIVTSRFEAEQELRRIASRTQTDQVFQKENDVREILLNVRRLKDEALLRYTLQFDGVNLTPNELRVSDREIEEAYDRVSRDLLAALRLAKKRIEHFHRQRVPKSWTIFEEEDVVLGQRYTPVDAAGLYIPGGQASYPSTVLMNVVPAQIARVPRIIICTPPGPDGQVNPSVLVAAHVAGVQEIYRVGGAQAIGAMAYGTETITKVDLITGPGNVYVTLAKRLVYGEVGIDSLAGPSEVLIIADHRANPQWIAADLLAQAEHDPLAAAILITPNQELADLTNEALSRQLRTHSRRLLTEKSIANYGLVVVTEDLAEAAELTNLFAPEHLELQVEDPWDLLKLVRHAGAIFLGYYSPEAVGDYLAGPNHTLPTSGAARFSSALGVQTFLKSSSLIQFSPQALRQVGAALDILTQTEGLPSHGDSVQFRLDP